MELILKKTVESLGREGDVVTVKPGYARNFLLPQGLAVEKNASTMAVLEQERATIESRREKEQQQAEILAKKLAGTTLEMKHLAGEEGRLFGSVTTVDIANALKEKGIDIDKRNILLADHIKALGTVKIPVKVGFRMQSHITVTVTALEEAAEEN